MLSPELIERGNKLVEDLERGIAAREVEIGAWYVEMLKLKKLLKLMQMMKATQV